MKTHRKTPIARSLDALDKLNGEFYHSLSKEDRLFVKDRISHFNEAIQRILINHYQAFDKPYNANSYLRKTVETLNPLIPEKIIPYFDAGESELKELSEENAKRCKHFELYTHSHANRNVTGEKPVNGAIKRVQDKHWWLRKLRKVLRRTEEKVQIHLGQVNSRKGKYCGDNTVKHRLIQKELQRQMLENIVNENNDAYGWL